MYVIAFAWTVLMVVMADHTAPAIQSVMNGVASSVSTASALILAKEIYVISLVIHAQTIHTAVGTGTAIFVWRIKF